MDATGAEDEGSTVRRTGARLVGSIVAVGFVLPALVTASGGGFGITRNDDYAFIDTMRTFVDHGSFEIRGPADMTLIGQILLAWPVARLTSTSITALQLTTLAVATAGLLATAALARSVLDAKRATLVAICVAANPMWAPLATSFMTDAWAWAWAPWPSHSPPARSPRRPQRGLRHGSPDRSSQLRRPSRSARPRSSHSWR